MVVGEFTEAKQVVVIGAGPGGYVAAIRAAQLGKEVTLISQEELPGGVCLLRGCIPSKALIEATKLFDKTKNSSDMGLVVEKARMDIPQLQKWKTQVTERLSGGISALLKQNRVEYLVGRAVFQKNRQLDIQTEKGVQKIKFEDVIIATGSRPRPLKGFEFDGKNILSSREALSLEKVPPSLLVIGGGYIGLELGGVYARLGSKVTIVEATDSLMPGLDKDLLRPLQKHLKKMDIPVHLNTFAESPTSIKGGLEVVLKPKEGSPEKIKVSKILVSVGRQPNTEDFGLDQTGVELDEHGFIKTNSQCQTSVPHYYAIGDVAGGMMLAHKASREGKVAAANIAGEADAMDNQVPAIVFTDPEIAYVGLQEQEAQAMGLEIQTGVFNFAALGRAITMNETDGFAKIVSEKDTQRILGVQMVGPHVSDLIAEATLAIEMGARVEDLALTIHAHPSLPEALMEAAEVALGMSIHRYQRKQK